VAGYNSDPLRTPLPPLLDSLDILHGALDGDAGRHHLATAGTVSLSPRMGRGMVASLLVAY
jgi:hypothetical protein